MKIFNTKYIDQEDLEKFIEQNNIKIHDNILLQIFTGVCNINFIEKLVDFLTTEIPNIKIIGTTTSGEIYGYKPFDESTILSFCIFDKTIVKTYGTKVEKNSKKTVFNLISQFSEKKAKLAISFADGLNINGEEYVDTFTQYDKNMIIAGGLAGDNAKFENTIVFTEKKIYKRGAVVALLYNDNLKIATKALFGWENIGKQMIITKSSKNIVYEIDGIKAVDIYSRYLGEEIAKELPKVGVEFPLIVKRDDIYIPRAILGKNDKDGSLTFAGNLNEGDIVTFGYGNIETILEQSKTIDNYINKNYESIFVYSCMARKALLLGNISEELVPLAKIAPVSGFFTYGEFFSNKNNLTNELLNQTMTILAISESDEEFNNHNKTDIQLKRKRSDSFTLKALSHLVAQTTLELEEINNNLEIKVQQEVEKNRQKDQQMIQQSRLAQMGEMISMIAHQWRQPLTAISSTSSAIGLRAQLNKLDKKTAIELSKKITHYSQHLSTTINDFREFFKINKEKREITYTELINSVFSIIETSIDNKDIIIKKELNSDVQFYTYPNEIKQVILNLLKNAEDILVEKSIENPIILIKTYDNILEVSDNGGGIPINIINKIFDPYFSTKMEKNGTGLGLYMSKTIIEDHCGGILSVYNNNEGAVFKIELSY